MGLALSRNSRDNYTNVSYLLYEREKGVYPSQTPAQTSLTLVEVRPYHSLSPGYTTLHNGQFFYGILFKDPYINLWVFWVLFIYITDGSPTSSQSVSQYLYLAFGLRYTG